MYFMHIIRFMNVILKKASNHAEIVLKLPQRSQVLYVALTLWYIN